MLSHTPPILTLLLALVVATNSASASDFILPSEIDALMADTCYSCHDDETQKGNIRLDHLNTLPLEERLDVLNLAQEQVYFGEMPPRKKKQQPTAAERDQLASWISDELKKHTASKLEDKLRMPDFGNYVDHDKLFSGEYSSVKGFTPDRRWLISEYIFDAKFNKMLNHLPTKTIDGKRENVIGDNNRTVNLTNPFLLPTNTGVRYYDTTTLNGGHLLTMITNAKEAADYMTHYLAKRDKRYLPAIEAIMAQENQHHATLAARETFLNSFIAHILQDIYTDRHKLLLPPFVSLANDSQQVTTTTSETATKKAPYHAANPGTTEVVLIYHSMQRLKGAGDTDAQLIRKCEQEWFNFGHNERKIQTRLTFLDGYLKEFRDQITTHRYAEKYKLPVYKPRSEEEMELITAAILKHRKQGDRYNEIIQKCMADWKEEFTRERIAAGPPDADLIAALVEQLFVKILERSPTSDEAEKYASLTTSYIQNLGNPGAIEKLIQTLILRSEFVYRSEFGQGEPDAYGRKMLSPRDASYAIAYALTDSSPDDELLNAAQNGQLRTRADYKREIQRLLKNRDQFYVIDEGVQRLHLTASITSTPIRKLRFFRDFFGYPTMLPIFKDNKRFGSDYDKAKGRLVGEADRLVDHILLQDKNVFEELLSTEDFFVFHSGDNEAMTASSERIGEIYAYFKDLNWQDFEQEDLLDHTNFLARVNMRGVDVKNLSSQGRRNSIREFKTAMTSFTARFDKGQTAAAPFVSFPAHGLYNASTRTGLQLRSPEVARFFNIALDNWNYPSVQPAKVAHRKGMLTHPAWLIAHAQNTETDPVKRGKWVREKLLAGTVPDIPITVDAVIPEDHHRTLRDRLVAVTETEYCWNCHERMNPLGYAFEMYDDFGRYRTDESLEHPDNLIKKNADKGSVYEDLRDVYKTLPVNTRGYLDGTGDKNLDGEVAGAIDLAERLTKSIRVRQSIIRHAFRYFMGRNEVLSDSNTLIEADQAYVNSGGSFDAVIVSLLTSDSFIFRK